MPLVGDFSLTGRGGRKMPLVGTVFVIPGGQGGPGILGIGDLIIDFVSGFGGYRANCWDSDPKSSKRDTSRSITYPGCIGEIDKKVGSLRGGEKIILPFKRCVSD